MRSILFLSVLAYVFYVFMKSYQDKVHEVFSRKYLSDEELSRDIRKVDHRILNLARLEGLRRTGVI